MAPDIAQIWACNETLRAFNTKADTLADRAGEDINDVKNLLLEAMRALKELNGIMGTKPTEIEQAAGLVVATFKKLTYDPAVRKDFIRQIRELQKVVLLAVNSYLSDGRLEDPTGISLEQKQKQVEEQRIAEVREKARQSELRENYLHAKQVEDKRKQEDESFKKDTIKRKEASMIAEAFGPGGTGTVRHSTVAPGTRSAIPDFSSSSSSTTTAAPPSSSAPSTSKRAVGSAGLMSMFEAPSASASASPPATAPATSRASAYPADTKIDLASSSTAETLEAPSESPEGSAPNTPPQAKPKKKFFTLGRASMASPSSSAETSPKLSKRATIAPTSATTASLASSSDDDVVRDRSSTLAKLTSNSSSYDGSPRARSATLSPSMGRKFAAEQQDEVRATPKPAAPPPPITSIQGQLYAMRLAEEEAQSQKSKSLRRSSTNLLRKSVSTEGLSQIPLEDDSKKSGTLSRMSMSLTRKKGASMAAAAAGPSSIYSNESSAHSLKTRTRHDMELYEVKLSILMKRCKGCRDLMLPGARALKCKTCGIVSHSKCFSSESPSFAQCAQVREAFDSFNH